MSKKTKRSKKRTSGYISRMRLAVSAMSIVVAGVLFTVYALSLYHMTTVVSLPPILYTRSTGTDTSLPASANVVTPGSSSQVPSLAPANIPSNTIASYQSTNWAGYLATGAHYTAITGTWTTTRPSATSEKVESGDGAWIGIGGVSTADLIQIGTQNTISSSGIVTTTAFYELLPDGAQGTASLTITPGDTISASIIQTSENQWTLAMTNVTTGRTFSKSVNYTSSLSSAEWIQEDPGYTDGSLVLLDNFGTVQFANATTTVNNAIISAGEIGASPIIMIGQGGAVGHGGTPGNLSDSSFNVSYH